MKTMRPSSVFQSLIGTIQTEGLLDSEIADRLFQSLIGTIQTRTHPEHSTSIVAWFQSLIGTIQTIHHHIDDFTVEDVFQSLIGTIQTPALRHPRLDKYRFQSLIGTIQTWVRGGNVNACIFVVSIPHRYDTNGGVRGNDITVAVVSIPHRYDTNSVVNLSATCHALGFNPS